jgi:hypothetical protein
LPNIRHVSALTSIFCSGTFPRRDRGLFDRTHLHWFTFRDACALLNENGLELLAFYQGLRWGDVGGGRLNRLLNRLPDKVKRSMPVREFLRTSLPSRPGCRWRDDDAGPTPRSLLLRADDVIQ